MQSRRSAARGMCAMLMLAAMAVADASVHPAYVGRTGDCRAHRAVERTMAARSAARTRRDPECARQRTGSGHHYRLRPQTSDVYRGFASGRTFIYSQSSRLHLQQLATLMAAHEIPANIYLTPKVSAFLYRDGWGAPDDRVATLPGGAQGDIRPRSGGVVRVRRAGCAQPVPCPGAEVREARCR